MVIVFKHWRCGNTPAGVSITTMKTFSFKLVINADTLFPSDSLVELLLFNIRFETTTCKSILVIVNLFK